MFPFDRLVKTFDELVACGRFEDAVFAQIGHGEYEPRHMPFARFIGKPEYEQRVRDASLMVAHAGAGTIAMALSHQKPLLVLPRLKRFGECVNDHQVATARKFEELGHVLAAYEAGELAAKFDALKHFVPRRREADTQALARRIGTFLESLRP
jgi:beta-1,4-N-acetylglucosaminyltransferase